MNEIVTLNRGSYEYEGSPEQVHLDLISNFKFTDSYAKARMTDQHAKERNDGCLSAFDLCGRLCDLARMVISYSHLFTVWKKFVSRKPRSAIRLADKWLTYRVTIGYAVIDQGKRFSQKDTKDAALSENMINDHMMGYTGCGLDDFDKNGERRPPRFKFRSRYSENAWKFFKQLKFQKSLLQPIGEYIKIVHDEYMDKLRVWGWKLDDLLTLKNMDFSDDIETVPPQFLILHWEMLYNNGDELGNDSRRIILDTIKLLGTSKVVPPSQKTHPSTSVKSTTKTKESIPENPQDTFKSLYGEGVLSDLPPQALNLFSTASYVEKRNSKAIWTFKKLKKQLETGSLSRPDNVVQDSDSDESVGKIRYKNKLSTSEGQFIISLPRCIGMHLGFHAPCYDDEWCWCPFSKLVNNKWHQIVGIDSKLEPKLCSSSKKFGPSDLVSHIQEKHKDLLGHGVVMYLNSVFEDAFGDGESK